MAKRRPARRTLALPWERKGTWLRDLVTGRRWKAALLAVLATLILVGVARAADQRHRERETRAAITEIKRGIAAFRADLGRCPTNLYELLHPPRTGSQRYLRHIPVDGWGQAFWVRCPGRYDPGGADVVSAGPSGNLLYDDNLH